LIAEFDGSTGNLKKEYLYGGATLITIEPTAVNANGTQYTTSDNLGSPRVITNGSGSVVSRHDYRPFGEELCAGTGGRTTGMGFCGGGDTNRKKFTGYERDSETGLDFAQARYFSSTEGRFTSPDTLLGSVANPQSLNRYAYVGNNPLGYSDPTGHLPVAVTGPAPGAWGDSDSPATPGDLPARYEEEIAGIKAVIAANRSAGAGGLGSAAALCGSNDEAPEHVDEAGHSGEQATEGGEHETQNAVPLTTSEVDSLRSDLTTTLNIKDCRNFTQLLLEQLKAQTNDIMKLFDAVKIGGGFDYRSMNYEATAIGGSHASMSINPSQWALKGAVGRGGTMVHELFHVAGYDHATIATAMFDMGERWNGGWKAWQGNFPNARIDPFFASADRVARLDGAYSAFIKNIIDQHCK
jgi:RHS repeat-associated protein